MAIQRLKIDGYGQLELNNVVFRRDGHIEAQCKLDPVEFAETPAENGMILAIDKTAGVIKKPVNEDLPLGLVYSTEHMYDQREKGLKYFANTVDGFLPRLGLLSKNETYTTNTLSYEDTDFSGGLEAIKTALVPETLKSTPVYGKVHTDGTTCLVKTKPESGTFLKVVKEMTMPDGQFGVQLQVINA